MNRRGFLRGIGLSIGGLILAACQRAGLVSPTSAPAAPTIAVDHPQPTAAPTQAARPGGPLKPYGIESAVPITPNEDFYTVSYHGDLYPEVDGSAWRLEVAGVVDQPVSLGLDDLKALPVVIQMRTLECIGNPVGGRLISNAVWKCARLADVLALSGIGPGAVELKIEGADGYATSIPLSLAQHPDSLLAYEMNESPLPREHGFPIRCLFPGRYGQKQPKWVTRLDVIDKAFLGHWEKQGWSNDASVRINSRIDRPGAGDRVTVGQPFEISGVAFADASGVQRLEVAAGNSGGWAEAELTHGPSNYVWTMWRYGWTPGEAGTASIRARGTDGHGVTQVRDPEQAILGGTKPSGTSNIHIISTTVAKGN